MSDSAPSAIAVEVTGLSHSYGARRALEDLSLRVRRGEIFGILGPNGSGKTTLFRILSTLFRADKGDLSVAGADPTGAPALVRARIGVVFQSPSLDVKLTVAENLRHQGHLFGLYGAPLRARIDALLAALNLSDRRDDLVETLSGGLARRVEVAKGLLHEPSLLLLDEPSTGLDPGARRELWELLGSLQREQGITVLVTTHLLEEAEGCDRLLILDRGRQVALGSPSELRAGHGGEVLAHRGDDAARFAGHIAEEMGLEATALADGSLRLESEDPVGLAARVRASYTGEIVGLTVARPTLEDVFVNATGRRFSEEDES